MTCEGIALLQMLECDIDRTNDDEKSDNEEEEDNGNNGNNSDNWHKRANT